jgi:hypothetical protein
MAFGSGNDIDIILRVKDDGSIQLFDQAGEKLEALEKNTDKAGSGFTKAQAKLLAFNSTLDLVKKAAAGLDHAFDFIERGANVDDVASSFQRLSQQAGASSDVLLNQLDKALDGTVAKTDLMKQANELLLGGLDPSKFELIAQAARKFAEVTGTNAAQGMQALSDSLLRGNDRALKTLGIVVDNAKALDDYRQKMGIYNRELTETEQVEAHREANLQALMNSAGRLATVTEDAGDKVAQLKAAYKNEMDQVARNIANDTTLLSVMNDLVRVFGEFPKLVSESIRALQGQDQEFNRGIQFLKDYAGELLSGRTAISAYTAALLDGAGRMAEAAAKNKQINQSLSSDFKVFATARDQATASNAAAAAELKSEADANRAMQQWLDKLEGDRQDQLKRSRQAQDQFTEALKRSNEEIRKVASDGSLSTLQQKLENVFSDKAEGIIGPQEMIEKLKELRAQYPQTAEGVQQFANDEQVAMQASKDAVDHLTDAQKRWDEAMRQSGGDAQKAWEIIAGGAKEAVNWSEVAADAINQVGSALRQLIFDGADLKKTFESLGAGLGGSAGAALGASFGPVGEAVGQQLGSIIGEGLVKGVESLLGGDSAGTKARKAVDKWIASLFDKDHLTVIINGQLQQIKDFDFGGGDFGNAASGFFNQITSMAPGAQAAFEGVGTAIARLTGQSQEFASNFAAAIANNLQDLNNLQLFVEATGKSFEDLGNAVIESMMAGQIAVQDAAAQLQQLQNLMQKGIPGAVGAVDKAWANLQSAGDKGGRALLDAISDIGAEARELGVKTLPQLEDMLVNTFHVPRSEADKFFEALSVAGVKSFDDLLNASNSTLIAIGANYENLIKGLNASFAGVGAPDDSATPNFPSAPTNSGAGSHSGGGGGGGGSGQSAADKAKEDAKKRADANKDYAKSVDDIVRSSQDYETILAALNKGEVTSAQASAEMLIMRQKAALLFDAETAAQKALEAEEAKGKRASQDKIRDLFATLSQAQQAIDQFEKGATDAKNGVENGSFLLPANFQVTVDAGGLDMRDVANLAQNLNSLPLVKTFTLKLQISGSERDKAIISKAASGSFSNNVGLGIPSR